jgi:hypothetical protein
MGISKVKNNFLPRIICYTTAIANPKFIILDILTMHSVNK